MNQFAHHHTPIRTDATPFPETPGRRLSRAEKWGLAAAATGIAVALLAWWYPQPPSGPTPAAPPSQASAPANGPTGGPATRGGTPGTGATGTGPTPAAAPVALAGLAPQSGKANLTTLPRALQGSPGYDSPVVVSCPTNQNDDRVREVNYPLRGRYLAFSATVRPYFAARPDGRATVHAITGHRERDGTLTRRETGSQLAAAADAPAPLTASVEGAEELTLQVRCEEPDGVVVLAGASLSR